MSAMRKPLVLLSVAVLVASSLWLRAEPEAAKAPPTTAPAAPALLNFTMDRLDGTPQPLSAYAGKVVLIVNTASKCGFTKQYTGLEALHKKYASQGLAVLGFPSNSFKQDVGSDSEIAEFCKANYGVTFDLFSKIDVKGDEQAPLYKLLTSPETNKVEPGEVKWNFEKFLISRDGQIVARFRSKVTPEDADFVKAVEAELAKGH
jgi:glutathione peroxidase